LYLSNKAFQASPSSGGKAPLIGSHSVIDSPESVSLVAPPIRIMAYTIRPTIANQRRMDLRAFGSFTCKDMCCTCAYSGDGQAVTLPQGVNQPGYLRNEPMRKPIAIIVLLVYLAGYIWLISMLAPRFADVHSAIQLLFYASSGIVWVFPLKRLFGWMNANKRPPE